MDVLVLIDKLDDLVHNAKPVPLTDQVRVDKEEIYDILDQMRATIPEEIKQARWIVKERQEMLAEAKREAERIVKEARERQERMVSEEEITKQAERGAEDIIEDARAREREIRLGAEDYADEILNTLEVNLSKFIAAVRRGRERLAGKKQPAEAACPPPPVGAGLMRALVIQHDDNAPAGRVSEWLEARGAGQAVWLIGRDERERDPLAYELIVSLGSDHAAYDDAVPWLGRELALLREAFEAEVPVLGICFGSQVLARALGGRAMRAPKPEIGWVARLTREPELG